MDSAPPLIQKLLEAVQHFGVLLLVGMLALIAIGLLFGLADGPARGKRGKDATQRGEEAAAPSGDPPSPNVPSEPREPPGGPDDVPRR